MRGQRINWDRHTPLLLHEGQVKQYYRMISAAFENLLTIVDPSLTVNEEMPILRTGIKPITPVNQLRMTISCIVGYSFHPCCAAAGVNKSSFYLCT